MAIQGMTITRVEHTIVQTYLKLLSTFKDII